MEQGAGETKYQVNDAVLVPICNHSRILRVIAVLQDGQAVVAPWNDEDLKAGMFPKCGKFVEVIERSFLRSWKRWEFVNEAS